MFSTTLAEMCRDVCLYSNTDLSIVQENVAESERASSSGVCEAADTLEVTVTFQTADAFDSHFYLNRTVSKIWKHVPSEKTAEDLLSYTYQSNRQSQLTVNIIWGVLNYSEPSTHPELIQPNSCWRTHRGENFTHENNARFSKCGGIGGDWTGSDSVLKSMEETGGFFRKVFSLVRQEKSSDPSFPTIWIN